MNKRFVTILFGLMSMLLSAADRFPKPQFEKPYVPPEVVWPYPRLVLPDILEAFLFTVVLALGVWLVLFVRRRRPVMVYSLACLAWYGFIRRGCICPVGAIRNASDALLFGTTSDWLGLFFFCAPLLTALLFGRIFCAGACPLGALQDLFIVKPLRLPVWLDRLLRLVPVVVLTAAVVCAANGMFSLICRTDPFVGFFRGCGTPDMFFTGIVILAIGTVIARPYCRYFCPYGVLLGWCTAVSWKKPVITPEDCIHCNLCAGICPTDAIVHPEQTPKFRKLDKLFRSFILRVFTAPLLVFVFAAAGFFWSLPLAHHLPESRLHLALTVPSAKTAAEADAVISSGRTPSQVAEAAAVSERRFHFHCMLGGGFIGLIAAFRLIATGRKRTHPDYDIDHTLCVACARCYAACPKNTVTSSETREQYKPESPE